MGNSILEYIAKGVAFVLPFGCDAAPKSDNSDTTSGAEDVLCATAGVFDPANIRTEGEIITAENGVKVEVANIFETKDGIEACFNFYAGDDRLNNFLDCSETQNTDHCYIRMDPSPYGVTVTSAAKDGDLYLTVAPKKDFKGKIENPLDLFELCKKQEGKNAEDCLDYVGHNKLKGEDVLAGKNATVLYPKGEDNAAKYYLSQLEACKKMAAGILFDSDEPPFKWDVALRYYVTTESEVLGFPVGGHFGKAFSNDYVVIYSPPNEAEELNSAELQEDFPELFDGQCNDGMILHELLHTLWHTKTGGYYYFWMALQEGAARFLEMNAPIPVESKFETHMDEEFHEGDSYKFSEVVSDNIEEWLTFTVDKIEKDKIDVTVRTGSVLDGELYESDPDYFSYATQSVDSVPLLMPEVGIVDILTCPPIITSDDKTVRIRFISHLQKFEFISRFGIDCHKDTYDLVFGHWIGGLLYTDTGTYPLSGEMVEGNPYMPLTKFEPITYNSGACFYQKLELGDDVVPFFQDFTASLHEYAASPLESQYETPFCTLDEMQKITDGVDVKKIASDKFGYDDDDPWCLGL